MDLNGSSCTTLTAAAMRTVPRAKKGGGGGYRGKEKDRKERELKRRQLAQRGKGETVPDGVSLSLSLSLSSAAGRERREWKQADYLVRSDLAAK